MRVGTVAVAAVGLLTGALVPVGVVAGSAEAAPAAAHSAASSGLAAAPAKVFRSGTYYFIPKPGASGWSDGCDYAVKVQIKGNRVRKTGTVAYGACHAEWTNGWVRIVKGKVRGGCVPYHPVAQYKCATTVFPPSTGSHAMIRVSRGVAMAAYPPDSARWDDFLQYQDLPWG